MHAGVAEVLRCLGCAGRDFDASIDAVTCRGCGRRWPVTDGVLHLVSGDEDPAIARERQAVLDLEQAVVAPGPTDFVLDDILRVDGPLRRAFVALPDDDGSAFFRANDYFRNVHGFAGAFAFVVERLGCPPGGRVLDVGADLTWSTSRLAERGWRPVGIDINHHLVAARVLRPLRGDYATVNVDMHAPAFADGAFDAVTAFNALHHTHRLEALVRNLARVLRPGGRLGFVEPYWAVDQAREGFGATQIEAGINENVYRLEEWHRVLLASGFELVTFEAAASFNAVYERSPAEVPARVLSLDEAGADLFAAYYRSEVVPLTASLAAPPGVSITVPIVVHNRSKASWGLPSQLNLVNLSYHLYVEGPGGRRLVAFDNVRTPLPGRIAAGADARVDLRVDVPAQPGDYVLEADLVHEMVTWFGERGAPTAAIRLHVA